MIKLNKEICQEYLDILKTANEQWFYGYNYELADYEKLKEALDFFYDISNELKEKLLEEGKL